MQAAELNSFATDVRAGPGSPAELSGPSSKNMLFIIVGVSVAFVLLAAAAAYLGRRYLLARNAGKALDGANGDDETHASDVVEGLGDSLQEASPSPVEETTRGESQSS